MIFQMAYVSNVSDGVTLKDCEAIAATSEVNNARDGVTGCLMLCDGWFLQVLEGSMGAVNRIYMRIAHDERHRYPSILGAEYVPKRSFPVWRMRLVHVRNVDSQAITEVIRRYTATTAFDPLSLTRAACVALLSDLTDLEPTIR